VFEAFSVVVLAALGAAFGSFANVVIWRFPRGESVSRPPSHCPRCGHEVRWFDNIPVASWVLLGGKCRDCREPISARYPLVEATSAVLWVAAYLRFGLSAATAWAIVLFYLLLILSFIDLDVRRLPNAIVGALAGAGLIGVAVSQTTGVTACPLVGVGLAGLPASPTVNALLGVALGAGVSLLIALIYQAVRRRPGMGLGDVKLLGALGLFLGPLVLLAFFMATIVGAVVGVAGMIEAGGAHGGDPDSETEASDTQGSFEDDVTIPAPASLPFGPFLALGAVVTVVWGPQIVSAYLRFVGIGGL
jgi:leader peptidase (prepilin peptidase)/N-methyltransferase